MVCRKNQTQWDFSVTSGIIIALMVLYIGQITRRSHMPLTTQNKLTMTIWWSVFFNLAALLIRDIIVICLDLTNENESVLTDYALNSSACYFFMNTVMHQTFEWDLLGSMTQFQGHHEVSKLGVVKEDYNASEKRKVVVFKYVIWCNIIYHIVKVCVPLSTLLSCSRDEIVCN